MEFELKSLKAIKINLNKKTAFTKKSLGTNCMVPWRKFCLQSASETLHSALNSQFKLLHA